MDTAAGPEKGPPKTRTGPNPPAQYSFRPTGKSMKSGKYGALRDLGRPPVARLLACCSFLPPTDDGQANARPCTNPRRPVPYHLIRAKTAIVLALRHYDLRLPALAALPYGPRS